MKMCCFCLLALNLLLTSCSRWYSPPTAAIPLLQQENELQVSAGANTYGAYISGAFSPIQNIGITAGVNHSLYNITQKYSLIQANAGYYNRIKSTGFTYEIYGGYAGGWFNSSGGTSYNNFLYGFNNTFDGKGRFNLQTLQINLGRSQADKLIDFGGGVRGGAANYFYKFRQVESNSPKMNARFTDFFIEPSAMLRVHLNRSFSVECNGSFVMFNKSYHRADYPDDYIKTNPLQISLGLTYKR